MIIFGWGRQTIKQIGVVFKQVCGHCHNEEYWILTRIITWFTLFFIPVIPYEIKYHLSCPVCKYGLVLDHKQTQELKPIAEMNQLLIDEKITLEEYQSRMLQLNSGSVNSAPKEIKEIETATSNDNNLSYCSNCGTNVTKELRFCGNCGTPVSVK